MTLIPRVESGIHTRRTPDGALVASAFHSRDGWQVTRPTKDRGWHVWFAESEVDARTVLDAIGDAP